MRPPYIVQTINRFFWTGEIWDVNPARAKLFPDRVSAIVDMARNGVCGVWLIRPAELARCGRY